MVAVKREVGEGASHGCSQEHQRHGFGKVGAPSLPPSFLIVTEEGNGAKEGTGAALGAKECKALSSTEGGEGVRKERGFQEDQAQGEEIFTSLLQVRVARGGNEERREEEDEEGRRNGKGGVRRPLVLALLLQLPLLIPLPFPCCTSLTTSSTHASYMPPTPLPPSHPPPIPPLPPPPPSSFPPQAGASSNKNLARFTKVAAVLS